MSSRSRLGAEADLLATSERIADRSSFAVGVVQSYEGLVVCRLLLGATEAGLFPGVVLLLTFWYPRELLQRRVAFFFSAATLAGAFSGLLAYAIQFMDGIGNYSGWR